MNKTITMLLSILVWLALIVFVIVMNTKPGCSEVTKNRPNSLGADQIYENHNAYLFAVPIAGSVMDGATSIRFQPYNTMSLYEESVLFCGDVTEKFENKEGPMVITYDRVAHRKFRGIACHDLVSVFEVHDDQMETKP
jgi:hypothetical protein